MSLFKTATLAEHYKSLKFCSLSKQGRGTINKKGFYWKFNIKPSIFSKIYNISLIWKKNEEYPQVFILNKEVRETSKIKTIPHLYNHKKVELCLFYPSYKQFDKSYAFMSNYYCLD